MTSLVRESLRGLTTRGRAFLAAGLAAVVTAALVGLPDVLRVGVLLTVLPLLSAAAVARARYRLACSRELTPARIEAGQSSRAVLRLENVSRFPTGLLLVEDRVPYVLGSRPRFVVDRVESRGQRAVAYPLRGEVRGRYPVGPLALRLADPFGLCELTRSFQSRDHLVVTPVIHTLPAIPLGGEWTGSGESTSRSLAAAGEDDVTTREYRHGDPLHRVHWRSTARRGEIMVRREEQPWQNRATVLLDTRETGHRGEGPGASFEWAVSAAASVGLHLSRRGYVVTLLTDTGPALVHGRDFHGPHQFEGALLDSLAVVRCSEQPDLSEAVAGLRRCTDGLVVAVLGHLDLATAGEVARTHRGASSHVAVVLETTAWVPMPAKARQRAHEEFEAATGVLERAGWRVLRARPGDTLPTLWPRAARGGASAGTPGGPATVAAPAVAGGAA